MARWKYVVIGLVVVPMVLLGLFVGWVWAAFSGGVDDLLDFQHPQPTDPEVVAAEREAEVAHEEVSREVAVLVRDAMPGGAVGVGRGVAPGRCTVGQHNFKVDDDFDLSCHLRGVEVLTTPAAASVDAVRRLDESLQADGWTRAETHRAGRQGAPSAGLAELVPLRYARHGDGRTWQVVVDEGSPSSMTYELLGLEGLRDATGRAVTVEELAAATQPGGTTLAVGVSVEYFRE